MREGVLEIFDLLSLLSCFYWLSFYEISFLDSVSWEIVYYFWVICWLRYWICSFSPVRLADSRAFLDCSACSTLDIASRREAFNFSI